MRKKNSSIALKLGLGPLRVSSFERRGLAVIIPNALGMAFSVISIPLIIEKFGTTQLASLLLILAFSSFGTLYCLGIDKLILRKLCSHTKKRASEFRTLVGLAFLNFLLLSSPFFALIGPISGDKSFYNLLGVEPYLFFSLCFANLLLTIGRTTIWGNGQLFKLAFLNVLFNSVPGALAAFLWFFNLDITFTQFVYIFAMARLLIGVFAFFKFFWTVNTFEKRTKLSSRRRLAKLFWLKSLTLFLWSAVSIASDNFERLIITIINPAWRDIFVTLQSLITKINVIPLSLNVPLFLENDRFKSAVVAASVSYFSLAIGSLLIINIIQKPIEVYLLRETIDLLSVDHILTFGLAATLSIQNHLFAVALEKRGDVSKGYIPESFILVVLCVLSFAFYDQTATIQFMLNIYLIKELCFFLVRSFILRLRTPAMLKANGFNLTALTLMVTIFYLDNDIPYLSDTVIFLSAILAIVCFKKTSQNLKKIR